MAKRASGPPRRPRNPVAKAVRTPLFKMQVVEDKREREKKRQARLDQATHQKGEKAED
ncbi:MAG: hypothetical protein HGA75_05145 [Thiobacillus sp.]|nr:hypothetical protein [Thiobacillus sp.]